ncbi:hypothetical protein Ahy_Scaffold6g108148 isoform D [Arachis hypogaea]|uniref:Uncharacterized protein n=1 Tax=Arachis hypogaea TaxID=3818 RepID=A0A444WPQ1_ARAHY|nr:hypothetical protein Ahy_Scaffold6g108148 isoform D [Arachis hypogaea]
MIVVDNKREQCVIVSAETILSLFLESQLQALLHCRKNKKKGVVKSGEFLIGLNSSALLHVQ